MSLFTILTLAIGLSMDAFAVAICKGLAMKKASFKKMAIVGLWFGGFQGLMPVIGYLLGARFQSRITAIDHWITFAFLKVNITIAAATIGITTFFLSMAGVKVGNVFGVKYKAKAELAGGIILIFLGIKILLEHLGILT